jgi:hypothetical protein
MFNTKFFTALGSLFTSLRDRTSALSDAQSKLAQAQSQLALTNQQLTDTTTKLAQTTQTLAAGQVTTYTGKTGTDGLIVIDYASLGLKVAPRISFVPRLAKATDSPVFVNMVGSPTLSKVTIQARMQTSVVGLLPQYVAAANIEFDVFVRPVAA